MSINYGKIMRVHVDFANLADELSRKTQIPRIKMTKIIADEYKRKGNSKPIAHINNFPFKSKLEIRRIK